MDLTGQQILRLLEQQWERPQSGSGRMLSVSNGFFYTWDASQPTGAARGKGRRVVPGSMRLNGDVMDMNALYRVTVNSFMAGGGDRNSLLKKGGNVREGEVDLVAVQLYFRLKGLVPAPRMGRIQRIH
jgi:5'-nucleotidase